MTTKTTGTDCNTGKTAIADQFLQELITIFFIWGVQIVSLKGFSTWPNKFPANTEDRQTL